LGVALVTSNFGFAAFIPKLSVNYEIMRVYEKTLRRISSDSTKLDCALKLCSSFLENDFELSIF